MLPGNPLDPAHQFADVQGSNHAQYAANQGADDADYGALHHENRHDLTWCRADGAQDRDVRALVVHHHDQGSDDVERRHGDNHQQQQANHGFFHFHGAKQAALGVGPVIGLVVRAQPGSNLLRHFWRCVQVFDREAYALHLVWLPMLNGRSIRHVHQAHRTIQFSADLEDADHVQALQARSNPAGSSTGLGYDQGDFVTDAQTKTPRRDITQHNAELARLKVFKFALHDVLGDDGHLPFQCRIHTADLDRLHRAFVRQHAVHLGKRHSRRHFRVFHRRFGHRAPVINRLDANDGCVRHHAEDAVTHFALKTVHHRQHHDHRQHAQGEADHRGHGDKRNKTIAALGAGIARADKNR